MSVWESDGKYLLRKSNFTQFVKRDVKILRRRLYSPSWYIPGVGLKRDVFRSVFVIHHRQIGVSAFLQRLAPSQIKLVIAFMVSYALLQLPQRKCVMFSRFYQARFVSHKFQCFQLSSSVLVQTSSSQRLSHSSGFQFSLRTCSSPSSQSFQSSQALVRVQTKVSFYYFLVSSFFKYSFRFLSLVFARFIVSVLVQFIVLSFSIRY